MDIRCLKCGTEYELDDSRIPPTGLTVKCTTCGFIFKATRPVETPRKTMMLYGSTPPEPRVTWQIRKPDGTQFGFNDLTALRRLIQEGKVVESDEISRQGEGWRRISDIPEFAGFFIARAVSASPMVSPAPAPSQGIGQVEGARPGVSEPPAAVQAPLPVQEVAAVAEPQPEAQNRPVDQSVASMQAPSETGGTDDEKVTVVSQVPAALSAEEGWLRNLNKPAESALPELPEEKRPAEKPAEAEIPPKSKIEPEGAVVGKVGLIKKEASEEQGQPEISKPAPTRDSERPKPRQYQAPSHADLDDTDIYGRPKRGKKVLWAILILVTLMAVAAAAAYAIKAYNPALFEKLEELVGAKKALTSSEIAEMKMVEDALSSGDYPELKKAAAILDRLAQEGKIRTEGIIDRAFCHLMIGQIQRDEAADLQARIEDAPDKSAPGPQTRKLFEDLAARADEATASLEKSLGILRELLKNEPDSPAAQLAQAYYYVVQSGGDAAIIGKTDPLIEEARKGKADQGMLQAIKGARLLAADPNSSEGLAEIKGLISRDPKNIYLHYIVARAMLAAKRPLAARDEVEAALSKSPGNSVMKYLHAESQRRIKLAEKKAEPAPAPVPAQDAGTQYVQDAAAVPPPETQKQEPPKPGTQPAAEPQPGAQKVPESKPAPAEPLPDKGEKGGTGLTSPGSKPAPAGGFEGILQTGRRLQKTGRAKQAVDYFLKAAELDPERAEPHTGLGWCYVELEKFDQAISEFQKALTLKGPRCETLSGLGETYRYRKIKQEAIKYYQMYLQECPNGPDAPVARNNLNNLR